MHPVLREEERVVLDLAQIAGKALRGRRGQFLILHSRLTSRASRTHSSALCGSINTAGRGTHTSLQSFPGPHSFCPTSPAQGRCAPDNRSCEDLTRRVFSAVLLQRKRLPGSHCFAKAGPNVNVAISPFIISALSQHSSSHDLPSSRDWFFSLGGQRIFNVFLLITADCTKAQGLLLD